MNNVIRLVSIGFVIVPLTVAPSVYLTFEVTPTHLLTELKLSIIEMCLISLVKLPLKCIVHEAHLFGNSIFIWQMSFRLLGSKMISAMIIEEKAAVIVAQFQIHIFYHFENKRQKKYLYACLADGM